MILLIFLYFQSIVNNTKYLLVNTIITIRIRGDLNVHSENYIFRF